MARMSCGASLASGHGADVTCKQFSARGLHSMVVTLDFDARNSASASDSFSLAGSLGLTPEIRDTYASNRRLAGTQFGVDFRGGGKSAPARSPSLVQTYGG